MRRRTGAVERSAATSVALLCLVQFTNLLPANAVTPKNPRIKSFDCQCRKHKARVVMAIQKGKSSRSTRLGMMFTVARGVRVQFVSLQWHCQVDLEMGCKVCASV